MMDKSNQCYAQVEPKVIVGFFFIPKKASTQKRVQNCTYSFNNKKYLSSEIITLDVNYCNCHDRNTEVKSSRHAGMTAHSREIIGQLFVYYFEFISICSMPNTVLQKPYV